MGKKKVKPEKAPAIDKLLWPAVGVVIAFVGYYFIQGVTNEVGFQYKLSSWKTFI